MIPKHTLVGRALALPALLWAIGCSGGAGGAAGSGGSGGAAGRGGAAGGGGGGSGGAAGGGGGTAGNGGAAGGTGDAGDGGDPASWLVPPEVPDAIKVPAGAVLTAHFHAVGAQVYTCQAMVTAADGGAAGDAGATSYAWALVGPDAMLFDADGALAGTHTTGPTWTSNDGSSVVGAKVAQADSAMADAIPWLLLRAASNTGAGVFGDVSTVQRLSTQGGKAPATGCGASTLTNQARTSYQADYYFFKGGGSDGGAG